MSERREVTVPSALQAHQLRERLKRMPGVQWQMDLQADRPLWARTPSRTFTVVASPEQWVQINQWLQKVKA